MSGLGQNVQRLPRFAGKPSGSYGSYGFFVAKNLFHFLDKHFILGN
jgi:hypothetical protein